MNKKVSIETIQEIKENLNRFSEVKTDEDVYELREVYEFSAWKIKTNELLKLEWIFEPDELVFAEDSCGNYFIIRNYSSIYFLDHETDKRIFLSENVDDFKRIIQKPKKEDLPEHKVISTWIDPDFKAQFD